MLKVLMEKGDSIQEQMGQFNESDGESEKESRDVIWIRRILTERKKCLWWAITIEQIRPKKE